MHDGAVSGLVELLDDLHIFPIVILLICIGILGVLQMFVAYSLRVLAEVIDNFYEFRKRIQASRDRFRGP